MTVDNDLLAHADGAILQCRHLIAELQLSMDRLEATWTKLCTGHARLKAGARAPRSDEQY